MHIHWYQIAKKPKTHNLSENFTVISHDRYVIFK